MHRQRMNISKTAPDPAITVQSPPVEPEDSVTIPDHPQSRMSDERNKSEFKDTSQERANL